MLCAFCNTRSLLKVTEMLSWMLLACRSLACRWYNVVVFYCHVHHVTCCDDDVQLKTPASRPTSLMLYRHTGIRNIHRALQQLARDLLHAAMDIVCCHTYMARREQSRERSPPLRGPSRALAWSPAYPAEGPTCIPCLHLRTHGSANAYIACTQ